MTNEMHTPAFPETADVETSSDDYATRFSGAVGQWMLETQERIALSLLKDLPGASILDVGGGHGQLAIPLCHQGYRVTVLGSADSCRRRIQGVIDENLCQFVAGSVIDPPFAPGSFDAAICFRLLPHCAQWEALTAALCRMARRAVLVDYPTSQSVNAFAPMLFGAKKRIEKNTRAWRLFGNSEVRRAFRQNGFDRFVSRKQFFLPMALHRLLKQPALSRAAETACRFAGLTAALGSPVILRASKPGQAG